MKRYITTIGSLGDLIVMSGAAHYFATQYEKVYVPIHKNINTNLFELADCLFKDSNVGIIKVYNEDQSDLADSLRDLEIDTPPIKIELKTVPIDGQMTAVLWDEQFYTSFNIPFSYRYEYFKLPNIEKESKELFDRVVEKDRYILVSQKFLRRDVSAGIDINSWRQSAGLDPLDEFQVITLSEELCSNILYYSELIKNAEEIHCVPSSIFCLVDSLANTTEAKLFYHDIRKSTVMRINNQWNNYRWKFINYNTKL